MELNPDLTVPEVPDLTLRRHNAYITAVMQRCACISLRADLIPSQTESADVTKSLNIYLKEIQTFMCCC
jgi:hypothetical protein